MREDWVRPVAAASLKPVPQTSIEISHSFLNNLHFLPPKTANSADTLKPRKKMRTPAQIEASRRNGAKSNGPKTAEGRARSSQNAIKYGLTSNKIVILDGECEEAWEEFQTHFIAKFQPRDFVEERLVIQMAVNQWRLERVWSLQTATVDEESATQEEIVTVKYEQWDTALIHACSYNARKDDLKALDQYESRFIRNFDRALRQLNQIREQYPPQHDLENEPKTEVLEAQSKTEASEIQSKREVLENEPNTESQAAAPARDSQIQPSAIHPIPNKTLSSIPPQSHRDTNLPDPRRVA